MHLPDAIYHASEQISVRPLCLTDKEADDRFRWNSGLAYIISSQNKQTGVWLIFSGSFIAPSTKDENDEQISTNDLKCRWFSFLNVNQPTTKYMYKNCMQNLQSQFTYFAILYHQRWQKAELLQTQMARILCHWFASIFRGVIYSKSAPDRFLCNSEVRSPPHKNRHSPSWNNAPSDITMHESLLSGVWKSKHVANDWLIE